MKKKPRKRYPASKRYKGAHDVPWLVILNGPLQDAKVIAPRELRPVSTLKAGDRFQQCEAETSRQHEFEVVDPATRTVKWIREVGPCPPPHVEPAKPSHGKMDWEKSHAIQKAIRECGGDVKKAQPAIEKVLRGEF